LEKSLETNAVFPKQVIVDMNLNCLYGVTALYDASTPVNDVSGAIDERYGKWAVPEFANSPVRIWRVQPERFAIQLSVVNKKDEKRNAVESGTTQAVYVAFGGRSACNVP
jgi:hypothetical protein